MYDISRMDRWVGRETDIRQVGVWRDLLHDFGDVLPFLIDEKFVEQIPEVGRLKQFKKDTLKFPSRTFKTYSGAAWVLIAHLDKYAKLPDPFFKSGFLLPLEWKRSEAGVSGHHSELLPSALLELADKVKQQFADNGISADDFYLHPWHGFRGTVDFSRMDAGFDSAWGALATGLFSIVSAEAKKGYLEHWVVRASKGLVHRTSSDGMLANWPFSTIAFDFKNSHPDSVTHLAEKISIAVRYGGSEIAVAPNQRNELGTELGKRSPRKIRPFGWEWRQNDFANCLCNLLKCNQPKWAKRHLRALQIFGVIFFIVLIGFLLVCYDMKRTVVRYYRQVDQVFGELVGVDELDGAATGGIVYFRFEYQGKKSWCSWQDRVLRNVYLEGGNGLSQILLAQMPVRCHYEYFERADQISSIQWFNGLGIMMQCCNFELGVTNKAESVQFDLNGDRVTSVFRMPLSFENDGRTMSARKYFDNGDYDDVRISANLRERTIEHFYRNGSVRFDSDGVCATTYKFDEKGMPIETRNYYEGGMKTNDCVGVCICSNSYVEVDEKVLDEYLSDDKDNNGHFVWILCAGAKILCETRYYSSGGAPTTDKWGVYRKLLFYNDKGLPCGYECHDKMGHMIDSYNGCAGLVILYYDNGIERTRTFIGTNREPKNGLNGVASIQSRFVNSLDGLWLEQLYFDEDENACRDNLGVYGQSFLRGDNGLPKRISNLSIFGALPCTNYQGWANQYCEYDEKKRLVRQAFRDCWGGGCSYTPFGIVPNICTGNVAVIEYEYNNDGAYVVHHYSALGESFGGGMECVDLSFNQHGKPREISFRKRNGELVNSRDWGFAGLRMVYDAANEIERIELIDEKLKYGVSKDGASFINRRIFRNETGPMVVVWCTNLKEELVCGLKLGAAKFLIQYDRMNKVVNVSGFDNKMQHIAIPVEKYDDFRCEKEDFFAVFK